MIELAGESRLLIDMLAREPVLPCLPKVVALVNNEANRPEPDLCRLCLWFGSDPALAARLLRVANSPALRLPGQIGSVAQALALLGPEHLRGIAQNAALDSVARPMPGLRLAEFWRYSLDTARVARALAASLRLDAAGAFSAGLLHALGELVIAQRLSPQQSQRIEKNAAAFAPARARAERLVLGFCYADVSAGLAQLWHWPQALQEALLHQTRPFEAGDCEPLAGVLHLAVWRARAKEAGLSGNALTVTFPYPVGVTLGLDIDTVLQQDPIDWSARGGWR